MSVVDDEAATLLRARIPRPASTSGFLVEVISGPDAGKRFVLAPAQPSRILVGQSPTCEVALADRQVSRRHVALELAGDDHLRVTDLGSTNGTRVGGLSIVEALLAGGERIEIGTTTLAVQRLENLAPTPLSTKTSFGPLVGASEAMRRLYPLCERLANASVPVVIEGDTGTGKEVLAEALHQMGSRSSGPFTVFDCTAVPPNLLESALFGHERGSFTGATESRAGVFEEAHGGTLLIDEIGDLELELQAKLLRALERSEVRRIGWKKWLKVDVRVLAATRRDLDQAVQDGRFRDDLFYRLAVARIELPPLRKRQGDIGLLARHFWSKLADDGSAIPPDFVRQLEAYTWPGNVRELYNSVAQRVALGELARPPAERSARWAAVKPGAEGDAIERVLAMGFPLPRARQHLVQEFERRYVERVLEEHGGNVARAAAASGIALRYFQLVKARAKDGAR